MSIPRPSGETRPRPRLRLVRPDQEPSDLLREAAAGLGDDELALIDFDHTLLLANSTELYLDSIRPRWLGAALMELIEWLEPWRLSEHPRAKAIWRDPIRVWVATLLAPWTLVLWRRKAAELMREHENRGLVDALGPVAAKRRVIVSLGYEFIIRPMLAGARLDTGRLVAAPFRSSPSMRSGGKRRWIERTLGPGALEGALAVTDSKEDRDLLGAVRHPFLEEWSGDLRFHAQQSSYLPLRYTARVKYPGRAVIGRQLVREDLAVALLAFALTAGASSWTLLAVPLLWLSFHTIYELGYAENDSLAAAAEARPTLSAGLRHHREMPTSPHAWLFGVPVGVAGALVAASATGMAPWMAVLAWMAVLVGARMAFAAFNRTAVPNRIYLFPLLQLFKTAGYGVLLVASPVGVLLLAAQIMRQWSNYLIYRHRGDNRAFRRQLHRGVVFAGLVLLMAFITRDLGMFADLQTVMIASYCTMLVVAEQLRFTRFRVDARHRSFLSGFTDQRPE